MIVGRNDYRVLVGAGMVVRAFVVTGQLAPDGAVDVIGIEMVNERGVMDSRLSVHHETEVDAQADLLARVEQSAGVRFTAEWRSDKPGWWSAILRQR